MIQITWVYIPDATPVILCVPVDDQCEIRKKKRDILTDKRESGIAIEKRDYLLKSGNVDIIWKDNTVNHIDEARHHDRQCLACGTA